MSSAQSPWARVTDHLGTMADDGRFNGILLVTQADASVVEFCRGWADRAAGVQIHPGTRFAVASMSKMFTAAATLLAVGRGELAVTDRIVDLLPEARRPAILSSEITVHHLLTHTSGIGDYFEEDESLPHYTGDDYGATWAGRNPGRVERPDDYLPLYADRAPAAAPGEWHYSNAGYVLLGAVLEEMTGRAYVDVVTEDVLIPAGMADTGYFRSDEPRPDVAQAYIDRSGAAWRTNVFSVPVIGGGDGGALATARDIDRFLRVIADGSLLGPELSALMRTPHVPAYGDRSQGYGPIVAPGGIFQHGGGDPGVAVFARHHGDEDLSVVVLLNVDGVFDDVWDVVSSGLPTHP